MVIAPYISLKMADPELLTLINAMRKQMAEEREQLRVIAQLAPLSADGHPEGERRSGIEGSRSHFSDYSDVSSDITGFTYDRKSGQTS